VRERSLLGSKEGWIEIGVDSAEVHRACGFCPRNTRAFLNETKAAQDRETSAWAFFLSRLFVFPQSQ